MPRPDGLRGFVLRIMPWYREDEVEARHAQTQAVIREARAAIGRAVEVTNTHRAELRESMRQITERLDGDQ